MYVLWDIFRIVFNGIFTIFMVMFLLIKKEKKHCDYNYCSNSSCDFHFGHFVGAEDIPKSCMVIFSSQNQILGFLQFFHLLVKLSK